MGGDILGVGISGLKAFQRTLGTIGHNISNANTDGYSRQNVELLARPASPNGGGFLGNGVAIEGIERMFNQNSIDQVRARTSTKDYFSAYNEFAIQVDNVIADPDAGLTPALEDFFAGVQEVSNDPTSIAARTVMITEGQNLANRFSTLDSWFSDLNRAANNRITNQVSSVNEIAGSIASMNQQIIVAKGLAAGNPPNDLLDQRDLLIDRLSEKINVSVVETNNGSLDVFVGSGQSLVLGVNSMKLISQQDPDDPSVYEVSYVDPTTNALSPISKMLTGGDLGGVLKFREEILQPAHNGLGRLAISIAETFNTQHNLGLDLDSVLGTDFFNSPTLSASRSISNASATTVSMTVSDVSALTTDEYRLIYDGAAYSLRNEATNAVTPLVVAATSVAPAVDFDPVFGLNISLDSTPVAGDRFFVRPTREATKSLAVLITDPSKIAAASILKTGTNIANNLGKGTIDEAVILDSTDPDLQLSATITFENSGGSVRPNDPVDQYTVTDSAGNTTTVAWTTGDNIDFNGWRVKVTGNPIIGDEFNVAKNNTGISDNRNALSLVNLQSTDTMINGNATYHDAYSEIVVSVGNRTQQSEISLEAQNALLIQAESLRDSISGVNLDEEAANLLRFQQSYAAAAQVISAADELFQMLINAVGR